jgi:Family of unknown function (DUF6893)
MRSARRRKGAGVDEVPLWGWVVGVIAALGAVGVGFNIKELRRYLKIRKM